MTHFRRSLTGFMAASVVLCTMNPALGATTLSRITDITVDSQGNLVLNVEGEGFDPLLNLEAITGKSYRVVLRADSTAAVDTLERQLKTSLPQWQKELPVLESVQLQAKQANGQPQTTLYLDVCQKLLPQIRSNTGSQIVIALVGNHSASTSTTKPQVTKLLNGQATASAVPAVPTRPAKALTRETTSSASVALTGLHEAASNTPVSRKPAFVKKERLAAIHQLQETSTAMDPDLAWDSLHRASKQPLAQNPQTSGIVAASADKDAEPANPISPATLMAPITSETSGSLSSSASPETDPSLSAGNSGTHIPALAQAPANVTNELGDVMLALASPAELAAAKLQSPNSQSKAQASAKPVPERHYLMLAQAAGPQFLPGATEQVSQQIEQKNDSELPPSSPLQLKKTPPDFEIQDVTADTVAKSPVRANVRSTRLDPSLYAVISGADGNAALQTAWDSLMNGQTKQAETQLRSYLEQDPANATARFMLARVLLMPQVGEVPVVTAIERRDEARKQLAMAIARNVHAPSFVDLIELTLEDDKIPVAERLWERLHGWQPDDSMTYYAHGRILEAKDDLGGARDAYKSALAQQPDNPAFHYRLAQVEVKAGRFDAAWWELSQALMIYPDDGRLWKQMALLAEKRNQPQQALKYYKQSIPTDALLGYGHLLAAQNQPDKAFLYYSAAEDLAGDDIDVLFNLGMLYADLKRNDRAEKTLTRFLALDQNAQDNRLGSAKAMLMKLKAQSKSTEKAANAKKATKKLRRGRYRY